MVGVVSTMKSKTLAVIRPIVSSIVVAIAFILALYLFPNSITVSPTSEGLLLFFVLLVSYLVFSGKLSEIGGAGFVLRLRQVSDANIVSERFRNLDTKDLIVPSQIVGKGSLDDLKQNIVPRMVAQRITTLSVTKGQSIQRFDLARYLEYMMTSPYFRDVIFVDESGRFEGRIDPGALLRLLNFYDISGNLIRAIDEWRLAEIPGISREFLLVNSTNLEALQFMVQNNVDLISILDTEGGFVGILRRENIVDAMLLGAVSETKSYS